MPLRAMLQPGSRFLDSLSRSSLSPHRLLGTQWLRVRISRNSRGRSLMTLLGLLLSRRNELRPTRLLWAAGFVGGFWIVRC